MKSGETVRYSTNIGKQIQNLQRIYCPRCLENEGTARLFKQPLAAVGDFERELFCPHCELAVYITVSM